jgi:hypothetical protein
MLTKRSWLYGGADLPLKKRVQFSSIPDGQECIVAYSPGYSQASK